MTHQWRILDFHWGGLHVLGAPFWPGASSLEDSAIGEKAPLRARTAFLLVGDAPYPLRRASSWAKRAPSPAGRCTYNVFDAKIDPGLRYSVNGDEN